MVPKRRPAKRKKRGPITQAAVVAFFIICSFAVGFAMGPHAGRVLPGRSSRMRSKLLFFAGAAENAADDMDQQDHDTVAWAISQANRLRRHSFSQSSVKALGDGLAWDAAGAFDFEGRYMSLVPRMQEYVEQCKYSWLPERVPRCYEQKRRDYERPGYYNGRIDRSVAVPRCCAHADCLSKDRGRHVFLTTLRSDQYFFMVAKLATAIKRFHPTIDLLVYTVKGELGHEVEQAIRNLAELRYWEDMSFPNMSPDALYGGEPGRFSKNWIKLRAWDLEEYDAIVMLDADAEIRSDISYLFQLPTAFATPWSSYIEWYPCEPLGAMNGGFMMLRPCRAVAKQMMQLIQNDKYLQFQQESAEQVFLEWYFRYDRWLLPVQLNQLSGFVDGNKRYTLAGSAIKVLHHTENKTFGSIAEWDLLQRHIEDADAFY